jgi:hypothetical protein
VLHFLAAAGSGREKHLVEAGAYCFHRLVACGCRHRSFDANVEDIRSMMVI